MKTRLFSFLNYAMILLGIIVIVVAMTSAQDERPTGRLFFTDFSPNLRFNIFDLSLNRRYGVPSYYAGGFENVWFIDDQYSYANLCLGDYIGFFCGGYVSELIKTEDAGRYETIRPLWKDGYGTPHWSPNGKYIALAEYVKSENSPPNNILYVMDADGTNWRKLSSDEYPIGSYLTWSPDSKHIAFDCTSEHRLCIVDIESAQIRQVELNSGEIREPIWSPDSKHIAFILMNGIYSWELYIVDADGLNPLSLVKEASYISSHVWSPDSTRIVYRGEGQPNYIGELYIVSIADQVLLNLTQSDTENDMNPVWSPDSRYIAYFSDQRENGYNLIVVASNGNNPRRLTDNKLWYVLDIPKPVLFWLP